MGWGFARFIFRGNFVFQKCLRLSQFQWHEAARSIAISPGWDAIVALCKLPLSIDLIACGILWYTWETLCRTPDGWSWFEALSLRQDTKHDRNAGVTCNGLGFLVAGLAILLDGPLCMSLGWFVTRVESPQSKCLKFTLYTNRGCQSGLASGFPRDWPRSAFLPAKTWK